MARLETELTPRDDVVTMDADTILETRFVACAHAKFRNSRASVGGSETFAQTSLAFRSTLPWARSK
jgi:hypothetical protein